MKYRSIGNGKEMEKEHAYPGIHYHDQLQTKKRWETPGGSFLEYNLILDLIRRIRKGFVLPHDSFYRTHHGNPKLNVDEGGAATHEAQMLDHEKRTYCKIISHIMLLPLNNNNLQLAG
jgi:hypothetical protein